MVISKNVRNNLVGFAIVASSILIFLPVILSKDVIVKQNPDAIAIDNNGAVLNEEGKLTYQPNANLEKALNINGQNGSLTLTPDTNNSQLGEELNQGGDELIASDNGVEILEASRPETNKRPEILTSNRVNNKPVANKNEVEILTATNKKPVVKEPATAQKTNKEPEILVAQKPNNSQASKPAVKPQSPKESVAPAKSNNDNVLAGTRPTERFVVQVGVFSNKDNALRVVDKLKNAGIPYYAIKITNNSGGTLYRIYGGRSNNKNDLKALSERINKLCETKSKIVPL